MTEAGHWTREACLHAARTVPLLPHDVAEVLVRGAAAVQWEGTDALRATLAQDDERALADLLSRMEASARDQGIRSAPAPDRRFLALAELARHARAIVASLRQTSFALHLLADALPATEALR